jgi:gluconolactonase
LIVHGGLMNPEGPVLLADGSFLLVEMHESRGWVCRVSGSEKTVLAKTGRPNGLAVDAEGTIWVAESVNPPSLLRMTMDGRYEKLVSDCNGEPFLFANDLAFGPDGALYMTDSGVERRKVAHLPAHERVKVPCDGRVYRIDTRRRSVRLLDRGLAFANGIAFAPDNKSLFVGSTNDGNIWRYDWREDGSLGARERFANVFDPAKQAAFRGPDGMKFDRDGNLYCAVVWQGDVTVLSPAGKVLRRIPTHGDGPTNLCFGTKKIYVTDQGVGALEAHDVDCDGWPLLDGSPPSRGP